MLFIQSNNLPLALDEGERLRLLDTLSAKGFTPLIRSARRRCFELLVAARGADPALVAAAVAELERECAAQKELKGGIAYTPGELFCTDDCVFSLIFGDGRAGEGMSAGIVYSVQTAEPLAKLDGFCRDVREALSEIVEDDGVATGEEHPPAAADPPVWKTSGRGLSQGLSRFIAIQPTDFVRAAAAFRGGGGELMRASELLEENSVRSFLRRVQEMRREGYTPRRLFTEAGALGGVSIEKMLDAGLLEREVRVSCRKSGHALFDLPSPDSLAAITISKAKCSQCAAPVADEVIEETINPTRLAVSLLENGSWLNNRVYKIIRSLGVPESEIATGPPSSYGESHLAVDVCGNSFLFVTKDGDLTPAFCRRIGEIVEETEATHLVVLVTGSVEDEGRLRLYEFIWRRARGGRDLDMTLIEGLSGARSEIEHSFERAIHRELSRHLFTLSAALGLSASNFVVEWFKLVNSPGVKKPAASILAPVSSDLNRQVAS
ncbi:MAG TPA: hypothetical protein VM934_14270 [Pyrinomonadaceae bacterium]|jgi:hypothetical protein|nr:hypothetical protein [Pyrinomonadaceae bacterium]